MIQPLTDSVRVVRDPEAIDILLDLRRGWPLQAFFKEARSIDEAARETGLKANTLYRWVQKWCALGLLEVAAVRPKRGRPVKLYKTTVERFFIPFAATSAPTHEALLYTINRAFQEEFYEGLAQATQDIAPEWGYSIGVSSSGTYSRRRYKNPHEPFSPRAPDAPAIINTFHAALYLTFEEAKALQEQLNCLYQAIPKNQKPGTRRYLIQLRLTPAAD